MTTRLVHASEIAHARFRAPRLPSLAILGARLSPQRARYIPAVALFLAFLVLRLPFRSEVLVNWDAVQFALGTQSFDLRHHQPHPPGYIGYVALGWLLNHITGDPNASLTWISVIAGSVAPAAFYALARRFMPSWYAVLSALVFGTSIIMWYYSLVALTYAVEAAVAVLFLYNCYLALSRGSRRGLVLATLLLALLGALRQSGMAFLLPLWLYTTWKYPWPVRRRVVGLLAVACLAWAVPLLWLAGGPVAYIRESLALADLAAKPTSLASMNVVSLSGNFIFVGIGVLAGANVGLLVIAYAHLRGARPASRLSHRDRAFLGLWMLPPILTYLLVHFGQFGYLVLVMPFWALWLGAAMAALAHRMQRQHSDPRRGLRRARMVLTGIAALCILSNVLVVFFLPRGIYTFVSSKGRDLVAAAAGSLTQEEQAPSQRKVVDVDAEAVLSEVLQFDVKANDSYWETLTRFVSYFSPSETVILTTAAGGRLPNASFRHLAYYLPEYTVYAVGYDRRGGFGHLFTARDGANDYSVEGLETARVALQFPPDVKRLVVPDRALAALVDDSIPTYSLDLSNEVHLDIAMVPPGATLVFATDREGKGEVHLQEDLPVVY